MADIKLTGLEKVAILLRNLPAELADKVLKQMSPGHAKLIRSEVEKVGKRPDLKEALTKVLDEANEIIDPATRPLEMQKAAAIGSESAPDPSKRETAVRSEPGKASAQETRAGGQVDIRLDGPPEEPNSKAVIEKSAHADPLRALGAEPPELLTLALEGESARTISLLLNSMDVEVAGQIFKRLSGPKRKEVSICFTEQTAINPDLVGHIAMAVARKCQELRASQQASPGAGNTGAREKRVAAMLRGLERAERMETLGILEETDAELATRVKGMLYQFEDILRMDNPSVQKLLSDTDTKSLALAMSGAPQEIHEKLLKNLSKRAQESLKEEVELMGTVQAARAQQARQTIVEAIQRLDQRGELVMVEQQGHLMHQHTVLLKERLRSVARATSSDIVPTKRRTVEAPPVVADAVDADAVDADAVAIQALHHAIAGFAESLNQQRSAIAAEIAQASVELGVQIAERLLGTEIAANRQRLDQIVLTSLERIQASRAIAVKANPLDLELLQKQLAENAVPDRYTELLNFQRDDSCPRGRLKLETDELFIEWDTSRSLSEIRGVLLEEIYSETGSQ